MAKRIASTKTAPGRKTVRPSAASKNVNTSRRKIAADVVTVERRTGDRRAATVTATPAPQLERRQKVNRRRQIDPTTCERDYSDDEIEFMNALEVYKRKNGRMFPTCSEVLEVIRGLGYAKLVGRISVTPTSSENGSIADHSSGRESDSAIGLESLS